jgi:hypothetical protein
MKYSNNIVVKKIQIINLKNQIYKKIYKNKKLK